MRDLLSLGLKNKLSFCTSGDCLIDRAVNCGKKWLYSIGPLSRCWNLVYSRRMLDRENPVSSKNY